MLLLTAIAEITHGYAQHRQIRPDPRIVVLTVPQLRLVRYIRYFPLPQLQKKVDKGLLLIRWCSSCEFKYRAQRWQEMSSECFGVSIRVRQDCIASQLDYAVHCRYDTVIGL